MTHAGVHGLMEAIHEAKPTIMMPMFSDQPSNAAILEELGVGIILKIKNLTKEELLDAIHRVLNNNR